MKHRVVTSWLLGIGLLIAVAAPCCAADTAPQSGKSALNLDFRVNAEPLPFSLPADAEAERLSPAASEFVTPTDLKIRAPEAKQDQASSSVESSGKSSGLTSATASTSLRDKLRQSLSTEGAAAHSQQDRLVTDVTNTIKWTLVVIAVAIGGTVALKKLGVQQIAQPKMTRMKLVETLQLGRNQGVHLVEVGQERFVVAADAAGIKSLTLLSSWTPVDGELIAGEEHRLTQLERDLPDMASDGSHSDAAQNSATRPAWLPRYPFLSKSERRESSPEVAEESRFSDDAMCPSSSFPPA